MVNEYIVLFIHIVALLKSDVKYFLKIRFLPSIFP